MDVLTITQDDMNAIAELFFIWTMLGVFGGIAAYDCLRWLIRKLFHTEEYCDFCNDKIDHP